MATLEVVGATFSTGTMNISKNEDWYVPMQYIGESGAPVPLTGCTLAMMIRAFESDATALVYIASPDNGITITDAAQGMFSLLIPRKDTAIRAIGIYMADLVCTNPDGLIDRLWAGQCNVGEGVTRYGEPMTSILQQKAIAA